MSDLEAVRLPMVTERINLQHARVSKPTTSYYGIELENFDKETLIKIISVQQAQIESRPKKFIAPLR